MKRFFALLLCAVIAFSCAALSGCGSDGKENNGGNTATPDEVEATAVEETQSPSEIFDVQEFSDLASLHKINYEGDKFAGSWKITEGAGSKLGSFVYQFDGESKFAYLICGTSGYIATYSLKDDVLSARMTFGLNGNYSYKFSDDGMSVVLTNTESGETTTMMKLVSYDYIPMPKTDAKIDEKLLGAWKDGSQGYLYFDESGIMYDSQEGLSFTFYTYSAEKGKLTSTYIMTEEITDERDYKIEDDKLTYDGYTYSRISTDELV